MSSRICCGVFQLMFYTCSFLQVSHSQNTSHSYTDQTGTDLSVYPFSFTDNPPTPNNTSPLTTTATDHITADQNASNAPATANATHADDTADLRTATDAPILHIRATDGCLCDVTPDFCDIKCCCDFIDCGSLNLSSVFNGCGWETGPAVCVESWLMFRANIDPALVTVTGNLFCVQRGEEKQSDDQTSPAAFQSYFLHPDFLLREPTAFYSHKTNFYKVDDVILTYYNKASVVSALRQPSPGPATSICTDRNPAKFLRSSSLFCSRAVTARSCVEDSSLNARSYYTGFNLLRVPRIQEENMIPISTPHDWPEPSETNGSCLNVVSKVEYVMEYSAKGEIIKVTLNTELMNISVDTLLQQKHAITFQMAKPSTFPTPAPPSPPEGLKPGAPLMGLFDGKLQPLTVSGLSVDGMCSAELSKRAPVLFGQNTLTGCTFRSMSSMCAVLRAELLGILAGAAVPELVGMTADSQTDMSRVISHDCSTPASEEACESGCLLPIHLSVQVLWAQRGFRTLPQNHILGVKYLFSCQRQKCPLLSSVPVTTEVMFSDATVYPEAPRGEPQPEWRFPFAFFSRGAGEFDQE